MMEEEQKESTTTMAAPTVAAPTAAAPTATTSPVVADDAPPAPALEEGWSRDHHLIGHQTTLSFLRPDENFQNYYYPTEETVQVVALHPENPMERQPALWRNLIVDQNKSLAIDYVAADTQDGSTKSLMQTANLQLAQERMEAVILERVYKDVLPDLVLVAALEEIRSQFLKATDRHNRKGKASSAGTAAKNSNNASSTFAAKESPPAYYASHPNQYMKPPVIRNNSKDSKKDAASSASDSSTTYSFTPNQLVSRIKAGCQLAYSRIEASRPNSMDNSRNAHDRRSSSRLARLAEQQQQDDEPMPDDEELYKYWKVTTGGNVATFIMERFAKETPKTKTKSTSALNLDETTDMQVEEPEEEDDGDDNDDDDDDNPYLRVSNEALAEWLGRKTAKFLSSSDLQTTFPSMLYHADEKKGKKKVKMADIGIPALRVMTATDQTVWQEAMDRNLPISEEARLCIESLTYDNAAELEEWETAQFGKSAFALRLLDEEEEPVEATPDDEAELARYKEQKAWNTWRFKGIHGGYTVWPSWRKAAEEWRKPESSSALTPTEESSTNGVTHGSDRDLAQSLAQEDKTTSSGRRTRRGGETSAVFYGNQSTMTLKQMMDALLRITSLRPFATMLDLLSAVQDDSTDPIRRMRNALGRIIYKRNQLAQQKVTTDWTDQTCMKQLAGVEGFKTLPNGDTDDDIVKKDIEKLTKYMKEILSTELWLRRLVVKHLTHIPVEVIATAADERNGTIESIDDVDFENPDDLQWQSAGHDLLGKLIFRPVETRPVDNPSQCYWFRIEEYVPSVEAPTEPGSSTFDKPSLGLAKDTLSVERRIRFKALRLIPPGKPSATLAPNEQPLILTEGQVRAGIKAALLEDSLGEEKQPDDNPMRGRAGAKISLIPVKGDETPILGVVAGHLSVISPEGKPIHKMLMLLDSNPEGKDSVWAILDGDSEGLLCKIEGCGDMVYSVQEFDYDSSSQAFKECKAIIAQLQRHTKIGPFMEPVDPIALNIPTYFQVVKRPMDVSTLIKKLENGDYSRFSLSETVGSTPVARMLNGPFRRDLELIFNNAILFNPPDDWIHKAAISLKSFAAKKIEQACQKFEEFEFSRHRVRQSIYIEYDSDTDMFGYDDDKDEDYDNNASSRKRRRTVRMPTKEDPCVKAIERGIPLQKIMPDGDSLRGPLGNLPVNSDSSSFALPPDWNCRRVTPATLVVKPSSTLPVSDEITELIELRSHIEDQTSASLRRSTRAATHEPVVAKSAEQHRLEGIVYNSELLSQIESPEPSSRRDVELVREQLHEDYFAVIYKKWGSRVDLGSLFTQHDNESRGIGNFSEGYFPPYLGVFHPSTGSGNGVWEIRKPLIVPALRWVIRGLVESEHFGAVESLTDENLKSGVVLANNLYYYDSSLSPFDVVDQKEFSRRKKAKQDDDGNESDDDAAMEMSDYEKLRQDRVARNAERLKALGLA